MTEYRFRLILSGPFSDELTNGELLDATDALGAAGCDDASISVHADGLELWNSTGPIIPFKKPLRPPYRTRNEPDFTSNPSRWIVRR